MSKTWTMVLVVLGVGGGCIDVAWAAPRSAVEEAAELKARYEQLSAEGKYAQAEPLAERACLMLEEELGAWSEEHAGCLNDLGVVNVVRGEYEKAEPLFERALAIKDKVLGPEHPAVAVSLYNLASLYKNQGEYEKAEPLHERALAIREKALGPEHPDVAQSLNNLASLYQDQGAYSKAEPLFERALTIREKALGPEHSDVAQSLNNLALLYMKQGAYSKAEPLLVRTLAIREKVRGPDHPEVATSLNNLAEMYRAQGEHRRAESQHQRALAIREKILGPNHPHVASSLNNLALLYRDQGAYGRAEPLLERALAINEMTLGPNHPHVASSLNNLALLYRDQGVYGKAEPMHERALAIQEKALGPHHSEVAKSLNNLALLHRDQGAYEKAEPMYERALAIRERALGPNHSDVAQSLNNLAFLYHDQGAYEKAEPMYERALAIRERALGPNHSDVAQSLNNLAILYADRAYDGLSLKLRRRAFDIEDTNLVRNLIVADESRRLAYASELFKSLNYALSLHHRVAPTHDAIAELSLTTLLRRKNRVQDLVTQSVAALRRSLPEDDRHLLDELSDVDSQIAVLSGRGPGKLGVEDFRQQLDTLGKDRDRLWSELAKHSALVESLDHPVTIQDVQRALPRDSALIELIQYLPQHGDDGKHLRKDETRPPPRYAAYLVFPDRFDWVDLGPAAPIDEHIKTFRKALQAKLAVPTDLYDAVMRPIAAKLGSTHHLIIAPAADLSLVPFGALYDGKQYLIEQYDLRYVTTGRDLLTPPASAPVATTPITVVANPTGAKLPDAEQEADFLAGLFPHTHVLLADQATETNVRAIERPLVLHMATHGFFGDALNDRDNPLFRSGLVLADPTRVEVDHTRDNGELTAYEVSGMDLRGTQLVVLSACETGLGAAAQAEGKTLMSEGVAGLRRAFAMAGARTMVMSLWSVSGVNTRETMQAYYRKLAEGQGPGEAMQAVQLEMLRTKEHAHPSDWAAFIVSGDDTPLVFPAGEQPRVNEPQGPPPVPRRMGCTMAAPSSDGDPSLPAFLLALLGLGVLRRRRA